MKPFAAVCLLILILLGVKSAYAIAFKTPAFNDPIRNRYLIPQASNDYKLTFDLNVSSQISTSPAGTIIGYLTATNGYFVGSRQESFGPADIWALNLSHNSLPAQGLICKTNIPGIGIIYINDMWGHYGSCNSTYRLLAIRCPSAHFLNYYECKEGVAYPAEYLIRDRKVAKLVFTGEELPDSGIYKLQLPIQLAAYWPGQTAPSDWGGVMIRNNNINIVNNEPAIFFPNYPAGNPYININLTNLSFGSKESITKGEGSINICFYDGHDGNSKSFTLLFHDGNSQYGKDFSINHAESDMYKENRIYYDVSITNPLTSMLQKVSPNIPLVWSGTNDRNRQRRINFHGVNTWCLPSKLTLTARPFSTASKLAGNYSGMLSVIMLVNTSSK